MHGTGYEDMVRVAVEENVPVVTMTGGNPAPIFDLLAGTGIKKLVLVAARRQAQKAEELGADAVMVVGQEGGGHLGRDDVGTMVLVPQVVDSVKIRCDCVWWHWRWSGLDGRTCTWCRGH
ncbi:hypothetical protein LSPH24S_09137 [Lysinibacillus sphaericus]